MKTTGLIETLVADCNAPHPTVRKVLGMAVPAGIAVAIGVFTIGLDMRGDLLEALATWRYLLKLALTIAIAISGLLLACRFAQPQHANRPDIPLWSIAFLPLLAGIAAEAMVLPRSEWGTSAMGVLPVYCLVGVPAISLAPLVALLVALRHGAPGSPALTGAVAGVAAGGLGASIYAIHCNNDSPFFVGIWYLLAIAIVAGLGAVLGGRYLRW